MAARVQTLLGMTGFNLDAQSLYLSPADVGDGAAGFSALLAVAPVGIQAGTPSILFGHTSDGVDGWSLQRAGDAGGSTAPQYSTFEIVSGGTAIAAQVWGSELADRFCLLGVTYNGVDQIRFYLNGISNFLGTAVVYAPAPGGTQLLLGGANSIVGFANPQDVILGAMYTETLLTPSNFATLAKAYRATGSMRGALALQNFPADLIYDFVGAQPALPAPALVNKGTLGIAGNLTYSGTAALIPTVVPNELLSGTVIAP